MSAYTLHGYKITRQRMREYFSCADARQGNPLLWFALDPDGNVAVSGVRTLKSCIVLVKADLDDRRGVVL